MTIPLPVLLAVLYKSQVGSLDDQDHITAALPECGQINPESDEFCLYRKARRVGRDHAGNDPGWF
jgi:hypothetical protein